MGRLRSLLVGKFFLIPTALVLLYTCLGFIFVPHAVRWYLPEWALDQLHYKLTLGEVRFNPFLMSFEAEGLNLADPEGEKIAAFEKLFFDLEMTSLFCWTVTFRELRLDKPTLHIVIEPDGTVNLTRLTFRSTEQRPEPGLSEAIGVIIQTVTLADGEVTITDKRQSTPVVLAFQDIDMDLKDLSTLRDQNGTYSLTAGTADGEIIQWSGDICLAPFRSKGKLAFSSIQAATFWKFVQRDFRLNSPTGKLNLNTDYLIDANEVPMKLLLEGLRVDLSTLSLAISGSDQSFLVLKKLEIDCALFDLAAKALQINSLLIDGGLLQVHIDEGRRSNLQQVVHRKPSYKLKEKPPNSKTSLDEGDSDGSRPWAIDIEGIEVKDFALDLQDHSRASPLVVGISNISLRSKAKIEAGLKSNVRVQEFSTQIKDVRLGNKETPAALFEARHLNLEGGELDLGAKTIRVSRIGLSDGYLHLSREKDGRINLEHAFASRQGAPELSPAPNQGTPWRFFLKTFELSKFRSSLSDHASLPEKTLYNIESLSARLTDVDGKSPMGFEMSFEVEQGGKVALRGKADPKAPSADLNLKVDGLILTPLDPYLAPYITLTLQSAALSSEGILRYGVPGTASKLAYKGRLNLDGLSLNQPSSREPYIGWGAMQISDLKLALEPNSLQIGEIKILKPVGRLVIYEDKTVNLAKILKEQPTEAGSPAPSQPIPPKPGSSKTPFKSGIRKIPNKRLSESPSPQPSPFRGEGEMKVSPQRGERGMKASAQGGGFRVEPKPSPSHDRADNPFPFSVGRIRVEDGSVVFADLSLMPKFMTRIHSLKGSVSRLSSKKNSLAEIQLDGHVDQYGTVKVTGKTDLADFKRSTDITMVFRNVEMASVTPYSGKFAGRRIKSGKLSMDLKYRIQDTKLVGENQIIVDHLVLGEHVDSPDAVNLPLDLAIALLSDSNGRIDIGLPVSGDLNDPQFSIGPLLWKALVGAITKVVTAPFRALGALFGGAAERFEAVQFDPGEAKLLPPEKEKLKKVAEVMQKRPQLGLKLQGCYSPEVDGMELKQREVHLLVVTEMGIKGEQNVEPGVPDFTDSKIRRALEKIFAERFGSAALDELERAVERGEIKPAEQEESPYQGKDRKTGRLAGILQSMKLYKIIPGAKSPAESALLAGELYKRLVEREPISEETLRALAVSRAQAIAGELQNASGISEGRILIVEPEPMAEEAGTSTRLSLEALSSAR